MSKILTLSSNKGQRITRWLTQILHFVIEGPKPSARDCPANETMQNDPEPDDACHCNESAKSGQTYAYAEYIEEQQRQNLGYFMRRRYL